MRAAKPSFTVRPARLADALGIAAVHHAAVHGLAAEHYSDAVLDNWAPEISLSGAERRYREAQEEGGLCFVAESAGSIVGFGIVVPEAGEIVACYVAPDAARQGVGRQLLAVLEIAATSVGTFELAVRASINAKPFYSARGYRVTRRADHQFEDGTTMSVAYMSKDLTPLV